VPRFRVIPDESPVSITAHATGHDTHAQSLGLTGRLVCTFDERGVPRLDAPWSAGLRLPVESIRSGNPIQDRVMRGHLDASRHPNIHVQVTEARALRRRGWYRATADITFHGVTRALTADVTFSHDGEGLRIEGEQRIDMRDFGVQPPRLLILRVDAVVQVHVRITARERA